METNFSKTLITGSNGMVGNYVDFGIKTDRRSMDVTDLKEVLAVCKKHNPDIILHLAAETDVDRCERDPEQAYMVNAIGTYNVALGAKEVGAKMVYVSTAAVFDGLKNSGYTELDVPNPQNYYARSKYLGELAVKGTLKEDDYIIARAGWMFGGGPSKDLKFIAKIIAQMNQDEIKVVNDKFGSPTFGKDLIDGIKKLLLDNKSGVFHMSNKGMCSRYELAKFIAGVLGVDTKIISVDSSYFNLDANRGNSEAMVSNFDITRPWEEALKEYLETEWKTYIKK